MFGDLFNVLGRPDAPDYEDELFKNAMLLIGVGFGSLLAGSLQVGCWAWAAENQSLRLRKAYLQSVLRQECAWYGKGNASLFWTFVYHNLNNALTTGMMIISLGYSQVGWDPMPSNFARALIRYWSFFSIRCISMPLTYPLCPECWQLFPVCCE